jgi:Asp-tRNA(Asn)/Glu-tRNA(Gln) amidotransferase A subunit family amidase
VNIPNNHLSALAPSLRSGALDLHQYLDALQAVHDRLEPTIQALRPEPDRFKRLHAEADALREKFADAAKRPPLFGIPVGVKDIIRADGFTVTAGSRLPSDCFAGAEASIVSRLRQAGALILGITCCTEFAYYNPGPTRNPVNHGHTPGGSSSGSAAAVAASYCPLALATQTQGSVVRPAAFCGIIGYKATFDRIPIAGVVPFSKSVDTLGFFVDDMASLGMAASVVVDEWQPETATGSFVFGVPEGPYLECAEAAALAQFRDTCRCLAAAGHEIRPVPVMADFAELRQRHVDLVGAEFAVLHRDWYSRYGHCYSSVTSELYAYASGIEEGRIAICRESRRQLREHIHEAMATNGLNAWLTPAAPGPAPATLSKTGDPVMNLPWTHALLPVVTMPCGNDQGSGLPLGLQVVGKFGEDEALVAQCQAIAPIVSG